MIGNILVILLQLVNVALVVCCVMSFVMPQSELFTKLSRYVRPVLDPIRAQMVKLVPALGRLTFDVTPLVAMLIVELLLLIVRALF